MDENNKSKDIREPFFVDFQNATGSNFIHNSGPFNLSQYIDHNHEEELTNDNNFTHNGSHNKNNTNTNETYNTNQTTHTPHKTIAWKKS